MEAETISVEHGMRETFDVLRRGLWRFGGFGLLFVMLSAAVFTPLSAWVAARLIQWSGDGAVSNYDLASFFLSPTGLLFVVVTSTLAFAFIYFEAGGMMVIAAGVMRGKRVRLTGLLWYLGREFQRLVRLGLRQFLIYVAAGLPSLALAALAYAVFLTKSDINYYLQMKPPAFWYAVIIAGVAGLVYTVVAVRLFVRWIFSVPLLLFEGLSPRAALAESAAVMRGRFGAMVRVLAVWLLAVAVISLVLGGAVALVKWLLLAVAGQTVALVILAAAVVMILQGLTSLIVGITGIAAIVIAITRHYLALRAVEEMPAGLALVAEGDGQAVRAMRWVWVGAGALVPLTMAVTAHGILGMVEVDDHVYVTAHRGSSVAAPENSMSAVLQAIEDGADYAEIDVQETADGVIVLLHDKDLKRTMGLAKGIWEVRYDEIRELDNGSWFGEAFAGERITTLEEVIAAVKGKIRLNIELKFNGHDKKLAEEVARIVRESGMTDECVVTSLDYNGVRKADEAYADLKTGLIVTASVGNVTKLDVDFLSVSAGAVDRDLLHRSHQAGKEVHVWTVNEPAQMNTMIHIGVDNIITDVPAVLVELLAEREELGNAEKAMLRLGDVLAGRF